MNTPRAVRSAARTAIVAVLCMGVFVTISMVAVGATAAAPGAALTGTALTDPTSTGPGALFEVKASPKVTPSPSKSPAVKPDSITITGPGITGAITIRSDTDADTYNNLLGQVDFMSTAQPDSLTAPKPPLGPDYTVTVFLKGVKSASYDVYPNCAGGARASRSAPSGKGKYWYFVPLTIAADMAAAGVPMASSAAVVPGSGRPVALTNINESIPDLLKKFRIVLGVAVALAFAVLISLAGAARVSRRLERRHVMPAALSRLDRMAIVAQQGRPAPAARPGNRPVPPLRAARPGQPAYQSAGQPARAVQGPVGAARVTGGFPVVGGNPLVPGGRGPTTAPPQPPRRGKPAAVPPAVTARGVADATLSGAYRIVPAPPATQWPVAAGAGAGGSETNLRGTDVGRSDAGERGQAGTARPETYAPASNVSDFGVPKTNLPDPYPQDAYQPDPHRSSPDALGPDDMAGIGSAAAGSPDIFSAGPVGLDWLDGTDDVEGHSTPSLPEPRAYEPDLPRERPVSPMFTPARDRRIAEAAAEALMAAAVPAPSDVSAEPEPPVAATIEPLDPPTTDKIEDPAGAEPVEDLAGAELIEDLAAPEPIEDLAAAEPVEDLATAEPIEDAAAAEPIEDLATAEPVEESAAAEPVEESAAAEPVEESAAAEPVEESAAAEAVEELPSPDLIADPAIVEPIEDQAIAEPVEGLALAEPVEDPAIAEPVGDLAAEEVPAGVSAPEPADAAIESVDADRTAIFEPYADVADVAFDIPADIEPASPESPESGAPPVVRGDRASFADRPNPTADEVENNPTENGPTGNNVTANNPTKNSPTDDSRPPTGTTADGIVGDTAGNRTRTEAKARTRPAQVIEVKGTDVGGPAIASAKKRPPSRREATPVRADDVPGSTMPGMSASRIPAARTPEVSAMADGTVATGATPPDAE